MHHAARFVAVAALAALATACADRGAGPRPDDAAALEAAKVELAIVGATLPSATGAASTPAPPPLLARLTAMVIAHVTAAGADEARRHLVSALQARHEALRAALESGDARAVMEAKQALDITSAHIVVAVLSPRIVPEVIQMMGRQVRALADVLDAAAAGGHDVTRPRRVLGHVIAMLGESHRALEAGDPAGALLMATGAADVVHTMFRP